MSVTQTTASQRLLSCPRRELMLPATWSPLHSQVYVRMCIYVNVLNFITILLHVCMRLEEYSICAQRNYFYGHKEFIPLYDITVM